MSKQDQNETAKSLRQRLSEPKVRLVLGGAAIVVALIIGLLIHGGDSTPVGGSKVFHFQPDMVKKLTWTAMGQASVFSRPSSQDPWTPEMGSSRIQDKLNLLANLKLVPMEEPDSVEVAIDVELDPDNSWRGSFDGENFVWLTGNEAGKGATLDDKSARVFEGGRFAFEDSNVNWCPQPPKEIDFTVDDAAYVLVHEGADWFLKSEKIQKKLDPPSVEKWFADNCADEFVFIRDVEMFPFKAELFSDSVTIKFADGSSKEIAVRDGYYFLSEEKAIVPKKLAKGLRELISLP